MPSPMRPPSRPWAPGGCGQRASIGKDAAEGGGDATGPRPGVPSSPDRGRSSRPAEDRMARLTRPGERGAQDAGGWREATYGGKVTREVGSWAQAAGRRGLQSATPSRWSERGTGSGHPGSEAGGCQGGEPGRWAAWALRPPRTLGTASPAQTLSAGCRAAGAGSGPGKAGRA